RPGRLCPPCEARPPRCIALEISSRCESVTAQNGAHRSRSLEERLTMYKRLLSAVSAAALLTAASAGIQAFAQNAPGNVEKLGQFKVTGASPHIPTIPQTGPKADAIKKNLTKIKLPRGFHISLYALVPDARHMAVGPQGVVTFVGTRKDKIYAVTDRAKSGVAEEVNPLAS